MNVLHLNSFFYAGQTMQVFSLVREQRAQGINAHLIMDGNPSYRALEVYKQSLQELNATLINTGDQQAAHRYLESNRCDLLHVHTSQTFPLASVLAQQLKIPLVITCHGPGLNRQEFRPVLQEAKAIICSSQRVARGLRQFADKIHIIPSGVDLTTCTPGAKREPIKITLIATDDSGKQKGYSQFCKAVDLLENVEFYVVTNKELPSNTAKYLKRTDDVTSLLAQTDIVATSGRPAVEALAYGNTVIVLGRTYQGILTPEKVAKDKHVDLSALSGKTHCYRNMFYDLAKLTQNHLYLRQLQEFSQELAAKAFDNRMLTEKMIAIYKDTVHS